MDLAAEDGRELGNDLFAFTDDDGVEERRHRLRVHGDARPACDDERPRRPIRPGVRAALGGQGRDAGLQEHLHDIEVIHFVGNGEGQHVEFI